MATRGAFSSMTSTSISFSSPKVPYLVAFSQSSQATIATASAVFSLTA